MAQKLHNYIDCPSIPMILYVKTPEETILTLDVMSQEDIASIKAKIAVLHGSQAEHQHLLWAGKELRNGRCLLAYNMQSECTAQLSIVKSG
jgi:hypothetical protein